MNASASNTRDGAGGRDQVRPPAGPDAHAAAAGLSLGAPRRAPAGMRGGVGGRLLKPFGGAVDRGPPAVSPDTAEGAAGWWRWSGRERHGRAASRVRGGRRPRTDPADSWLPPAAGAVAGPRGAHRVRQFPLRRSPALAPAPGVAGTAAHARTRTAPVVVATARADAGRADPRPDRHPAARGRGPCPGARSRRRSRRPAGPAGRGAGRRTDPSAGGDPRPGGAADGGRVRARPAGAAHPGPASGGRPFGDGRGHRRVHGGDLHHPGRPGGGGHHGRGGRRAGRAPAHRAAAALSDRQRGRRPGVHRLRPLDRTVDRRPRPAEAAAGHHTGHGRLPVGTAGGRVDRRGRLGGAPARRADPPVDLGACHGDAHPGVRHGRRGLSGGVRAADRAFSRGGGAVRAGDARPVGRGPARPAGARAGRAGRLQGARLGHQPGQSARWPDLPGRADRGGDRGGLLGTAGVRGRPGDRARHRGGGHGRHRPAPDRLGPGGAAARPRRLQPDAAHRPRVRHRSAHQPPAAPAPAGDRPGRRIGTPRRGEAGRGSPTTLCAGPCPRAPPDAALTGGSRFLTGC
ncbi:hypothetical protein SGPA1_21571 [Streptomyces misionensis JCM 4497]